MTNLADEKRVTHSPAPWRVTCGEIAHQSIPYHIRDKAERLIAECVWHSSNDDNFPLRPAMEANARLIAAAPDLLALAKKLAGECAECRGRGYTFSDDGITGFGPDDREPTREACAECADIREVIAKAVRS